MDKVIEVKNIKKRYINGKHTTVALNDISFALDREEILVFMGRSGSGKTTLLNILGTMDKPDDGSVLLDGTQCDNFFDEPYSTIYRREKIGFVFQQYNLLKDMTAQENIALPLVMQGVKKNEIERRVRHVMATLEIEPYQNQRPNNMSGGQQQRVAIARAIVTEPPVLLADEPTGNLDYATTESVMEAFVNIKNKMGQSCIIATHDPKVATYADRLLILHNAQIISEHRQENARLSIDFVLAQLRKVS